MNAPDELKSVALPVPEIIGVRKNWAAPVYANDALFCPKFLTGFCLDGPCKCTGQI